MITILLLACSTYSASNQEQETLDAINQALEDAGPNYTPATGNGGGTSTDGTSELRSGSFPMLQAADYAVDIMPDSYNEVTLVVECLAGVSRMQVHVLNQSTGNDQYWFGGDEFIDANINPDGYYEDDVICYWGEFPASSADTILVNGFQDGSDANWLDDEWCNVLLIEPGGSAYYLSLYDNGVGGYNWATYGGDHD